MQQIVRQDTRAMWQYCKECNAYFYLEGYACPNCFLPFPPDRTSLPGMLYQFRLTRMWQLGQAIMINGKSVPMIHKATVLAHI